MMEEQIIIMRRGFKDHPVEDAYVSKTALRYIIGSVKDLFNDRLLREALVSKAAYLLDRIITQHPFVDRNKRTGFGVADAFLRLNGMKITADPDEIVRFTVSVAAGRVGEVEVRRWISQRLRSARHKTR